MSDEANKIRQTISYMENEIPELMAFGDFIQVRQFDRDIRHLQIKLADLERDSNRDSR